MIQTTMTEDWQITIPEEVRDALRMKPGDTIHFVVKDGRAWLAPYRPVSRLYGMLQYDGPPKSLEDIERGIVEGATRVERA